jgi:hypothetical protein
MVQDSWVYPNIEDKPVRFDVFKSYRPAELHNCSRGFVNYHRRKWYNSAHVLCQCSSQFINCLNLECKPTFKNNYHFIVVINVYLSPRILVSELKSFADFLYLNPFVYPNNSLCIVVTRFNKATTNFLTFLDLTNFVVYHTRLDTHCDLIFTNPTHFFAVRKRALLLSAVSYSYTLLCIEKAATTPLFSTRIGKSNRETVPVLTYTN